MRNVSLFKAALFVVVFTTTDTAEAQTAIDSLVKTDLLPGHASRADTDRILGQPVRVISGTLSEYRSPGGGNDKIYVQFSAGSDKAERVEIVLSKQMTEAEAVSGLGLSGSNSTSRVNARGKLEQFFEFTPGVVLTHTGADDTSPVSRVGYYSYRLFASAANKSEARPQVQGATVTSPGTAVGSSPPIDVRNGGVPDYAVPNPGSGAVHTPPAPPLGPTRKLNTNGGAADLKISNLVVTYPRPKTPQLNFEYQSSAGVDPGLVTFTAPYRIKCGTADLAAPVGGVDIEARTVNHGYATSKLYGEYEPRMNGNCEVAIWLEDVDGNKTNELSTQVSFK